MATRTLESRFERMSVNDENAPGDGYKPLKSKVNGTLKLTHPQADADKDGHYFDVLSANVAKHESCQSSEDSFTESKHDQHCCHTSLSSWTMASLQHPQFDWLSASERTWRIDARIR